ncbi:UNVERIFIED_CONTAM: hypothetical protein B566_EDAN017648 [Ephemera danica]|nr:hypothetical protein B566_EDAN017648 [Ephemera danica]
MFAPFPPNLNLPPPPIPMLNGALSDQLLHRLQSLEKMCSQILPLEQNIMVLRSEISDLKSNLISQSKITKRQDNIIRRLRRKLSNIQSKSQDDVLTLQGSQLKQHKDLHGNFYLPPLQVIQNNKHNEVADYVRCINNGLTNIVPVDHVPTGFDFDLPCHIQEVSEDLITYPCKYKAHLVSSDLAMSAGIALQVKQHCGEFSNEIKSRARNKIGAIASHRHSQSGNVYLSVVSKFNVSHKPQKNCIAFLINLNIALKSLKNYCVKHNVRELAIPKIASGLDKLYWPYVKAKIYEEFKSLDILIIVCAKPCVHPAPTSPTPTSPTPTSPTPTSPTPTSPTPTSPTPTPCPQLSSPVPTTSVRLSLESTDSDLPTVSHPEDSVTVINQSDAHSSSNHLSVHSSTSDLSSPLHSSDHRVSHSSHNSSTLSSPETALSPQPEHFKSFDHDYSLHIVNTSTPVSKPSHTKAGNTSPFQLCNIPPPTYTPSAPSRLSTSSSCTPTSSPPNFYHTMTLRSRT